MQRHVARQARLLATSCISNNNKMMLAATSNPTKATPTLPASSTPSPPVSGSYGERSYDEAISALNSLQTNAALLARVRRERQRNVHLNLPVTTRYLERSGMTLEDLDSLRIVHVSGTKGKGSTCAFCESILRQEGLTTGFFSSPHLVSATERIRLDGVPIDEAKFTRYFWMVYNSVCRGYPEDDRPPYFKFLTILAFNIFWRERVQVAVVEVGIGGAFDCTNIVRRPVVSGKAALLLSLLSPLSSSFAPPVPPCLPQASPPWAWTTPPCSAPP
jgi:folylpolyglutamate synthase